MDNKVDSVIVNGNTFLYESDRDGNKADLIKVIGLFLSQELLWVISAKK